MKLNREALKAIRERSKITQTAVARDAEIARPNYAHIEAGRREPTDVQLIAIAKALVVPLSAIAYLDGHTEVAA